MTANELRSRSDRQSEQQLVLRMLSGDEAAFRLFFDTYYSRLYAFAAGRSSSLDASSIADVVQITLIKAMRGLPSFRSHASLFTWLCAICWRELATLGRKARTHAGVESLEALPASVTDQLYASDESEPHRSFESERLRSDITRTLHALPEHYARALEMKYVEGRAVCELAEELGLTVTGAQSLLGRAREAYRVAWHEDVSRAAKDDAA